MDREYLIKYKKEKQKIKINLKNGRFYTGYIQGVKDSSLEFTDKYGNRVIVDISSISYIVPVKEIKK
jgi:sRNA-binding regulator protein Hfq